MLKNLTGRSLALFALAPDGQPSLLRDGEKPLVELPPDGAVRLSIGFVPTGEPIDGVPTVRVAPPSTEAIAAALPPQEEGVTLVVTAIVAPHAWRAGRKDVAHMGDAVLDTGKQIGARGLVVAPQ